MLVRKAELGARISYLEEVIARVRRICDEEIAAAASDADTAAHNGSWAGGVDASTRRTIAQRVAAVLPAVTTR